MVSHELAVSELLDLRDALKRAAIDKLGWDIESVWTNSETMAVGFTLYDSKTEIAVTLKANDHE